MVDRDGSEEKDTVTVFSDRDLQPMTKQDFILGAFIKMASDETPVSKEVKK